MSTVAPRRLLVGIALLAVFMHVCAIPADADVFSLEAAGLAGAQGGAAHEHDGDTTALHAASCEAVSPAPIPGAVVITVATLPADGDLHMPRHLVIAPRITFAAESPPLFLLHASLLI